MGAANGAESANLFGKISSAFTRGKLEEDADPEPSGMNGKTPAEITLRYNEFEQMRVVDVMIPRADIIAVDEETSLQDLIRLFAETTHSRLPVYRETLDDPVGFVHLRDLVTSLADRLNGAEIDDQRPLHEIKRDLMYVPPSMRLPDLLLKMQSQRMHLALVVDEYGGTDGLVTLEDLVEQIVGEIEDEHDGDDPEISARGKGIWEADARTEIPACKEETGLEMALPEYEDDIDTLGGVIFAIAGRVPQRGEIIRHPNGVDMEILEGDTRRIKQIRLRSPSNALSKDGDSGEKENQTSVN